MTVKDLLNTISPEIVKIHELEDFVENARKANPTITGKVIIVGPTGDYKDLASAASHATNVDVIVMTAPN